MPFASPSWFHRAPLARPARSPPEPLYPSMRKLHLPVLAILASLAVAPAAAAQNQSIVTVSAPQINCVFSTSCTVTVTDLATPYFMTGFLQSRVYQAQPGSPAAGKWVYEYRVDLTNVLGTTAVPAMTSLSMPVAAPIVAMDFNADGNAGDQVFVVTGGGLGVVGPSTAWLHGDTLHFTFATPVLAGSSPGGGQSSYFFGFVADSPPTDVGARIEANLATDVFLAARAPQFAAGGSAAPSASPSAPGRTRVPPTPAPRPRPRPSRP